MATTDPIYNLNGKKVTLTQIKESAALHGIPPEEYITKFGAVLTGKTTDSANATDPRVESGSTGSTLVNGSLEPVDPFSNYYVTPEDLRNSEENVSPALNKKLAGVGISTSQGTSIGGLNALNLKSSKDVNIQGPGIISRSFSDFASAIGIGEDKTDEELAEAAAEINAYIKEKGDIDYISKAKERSGDAYEKYTEYITAPDVEGKDLRASMKKDLVSEFSRISRGERKNITRKVGGEWTTVGIEETPATVDDFKSEEEYNAYKQWKKNGYIQDFSESEVVAYDEERKRKFALDASSEYASDTNASQRIDVLALAADDEKKLTNLQEEANKFFDIQDAYENSIQEYKLNPTNDNFMVASTIELDYLREQGKIQSLQNKLKADGTIERSKSVPLALMDFNKDYNRMRQLRSSFKSLGTDIAYGAAQLSILAGSDPMQTAYLSSPALLNSVIDDTTGLVSLGQDMQVESERFQRAIQVDEINSISDAGRWVAGSTVNLIPSLSMAFAGPAAMPLFFMSGSGGKGLEIAINQKNASERMIKNKQFLIDNPNLDVLESMYLEQQMEEDAKTLNLSSWQTLGVQALYGVAEVAFERLGTMSLLKNVKNGIKMLPPTTIKEGFNFVGKQLVQGVRVEGGSEFATTVAQNFGDIFILGEDKNLFEGGLESFAQGALMGGGMNSINISKGLRQGYTSVMASKAESQKLENVLQAIRKITGEPKIQGWGDVAGLKLKLPKETQDVVDALIKDMQQIEQGVLFKLGTTLSVEQAYAVEEKNRAMRLINKQLINASNNPNISPAQLKNIEAELRVKFDALAKDREALLSDSTNAKETKNNFTNTRVSLDSSLGYAYYQQSMLTSSVASVVSNYNNLSPEANQLGLDEAKEELIKLGEADPSIDAIKDKALNTYIDNTYKEKINQGRANAETFAERQGLNLEVVSFEGKDSNAEIIAAFENAGITGSELAKLKKAVRNGSFEGGQIPGTNKVIVNMDAAVKNRRIGIFAHEILHAYAREKYKGNQKAIDLAGTDLLAYLEKNDADLFARVQFRIDQSYTEKDAEGNVIKDADYFEEAMNAMSDVLADGQSVNESTMNKIRVFANSFLSGLPDKFQFKKDQGRDAYEFVKNYNKAAHFGGKGDLGNKITSNNDKPDEEIPATVKQSITKSVLDEINTLVPSSVKTQEDYFKPRVFNPIYKATEPNGVISNYIKSKSPSKEVAKKTIASIQERLVNYDPAAERKKAGNKQPITFGEFIFANTNFGKLDAKKALFKESEDAKKTTDLDNKEAQSIANEEGPGPTADNRKTYVSFVNTPKMIPNFIVTEVKTKLVDVISKLTSKLSTRPKGPNAQTTPLIAEIKKAISDVVGDPNALPKQIIKRMGKGTGDSYKAYLIANKKTILENLTTTYLQTAIPVAVEKSVGGKFRTDKNGVKLNDKGGKWKPGDVGVFDTKFVPYPEWVGKKIDREKVDTDKKGSTSGNDFVRRIEVSDDVFVANFIGQESRKDETKKLGLGKAIAEEVGFEVLTREIAKEDSDIRKAFNKNQKALKEVLVDNIVEQISRDVERGNVKFSLSAMTPDMRLKFLAGTEMFHERIMNLEKINKPNIKKIFLATYNSNDFSPAVIDGIAAQFAKRLGPVSKAREMVSIPEFKQILIQISNQTDETLALQKLTGAAMNATEVFADEDNIIISRGAVIENMQMLIDDLGVDEGLQLIIAFGSSTFSSQGAIGLLKFDLKLQKLVRGLRADGRPITKAGADLFSGSEDLLQSLYNTLDLGGKRIERIENKEIFFSDGTAVARKYSPVTSVTQGMLKEGYVPDAVNYKAAQKFVTSFFENFAKQDLDPNVALTLLSTFNNGTSNALRAAARVWGKSTTMPYKTIKVNGKRVYIYEHAIPARVVLAYLYEYHVNGNKDINIEALWDDYRVTIIPIEEMDNVLTNAGFSSITTSDYVPGKSPWYNRYYNLFTRGRMPYAMVSYDGKETVGKAYEQYFNEKGKKPLIKANATQELSAIKIQQKAIDNGRSIKWSLSPKKIRVFDFDDTLARTKNNVLYTMPDGTKGKIDAATFAKDAGKMEAEGAVWDFSEFSKVMNGKAGPLLGVAKIIADKRGTKDVFVLTARPSSAAGPIQQFLSSLGLNIPIANITGLGNGSPKAKADWIVGKVSEGYNDFYFADDHRGNVKAVKNALAPLDVKGKVQLAKVKFSMSTSQELTWKDTGEALVAKFKVGTRNYEVTLEETAFMEFDKGQTYQDIEDIAKELGISEDKDGDGIESSERFFHLEFGDTELGKGITGEGNAFKVFSTAINGVADYINKKKKIEGVIFTAKEPSRIRLYKTLSRALSEKINGSFSFKNNTFIVSKNPPVSDNISNQPKQVQDVLNTFDVKGKVQLAKVKFSKSLDPEFNLMIERTKGIESVKEFSKIVAKRKGASIGRYKFLVPAAEDFRGLTSYTFAGKGKQGEADQKFFEDALITPYFRGVNAIGSERQTVKNDFRALSKLFKPTVKKLGKLIPDGDFTYDQAVRVYLWTQAGIEVPGLSKRDQAKLNKLVNKDAELVAFANAALLSSKKDTWIEPGDYWDTKTMLSDLNDLTEKVNRKEYLAEFIENVDIIFSEKNLNKVEAVYGTRHREALEDAIYSMKNGTNRTSGSNKITNKWNNWVNSSIGAIMFFNRRSATMQLLSTVNFINWSDNNPIKAGAAFANQPQYWKDFAMIFNSDKLKQRRGGLKSDIQESEIANAAKGSKDNASAILSYLLKIGFTPTQIADSFAISMGGASMYRNRVETYKKQGLDEKVAEEKAWLDFTKISDETQQSGDPILVSQQQRSVAGRLILSFQNTTMQYNRLMKKSAQDLVNRRGDPKTHISQIIYYGAVQNFIFNALSTSLFALIPGFDDDDDDDETKQKKEDKKAATVLNGMMDSLLRGTGIYGAVIAAVKNTIRKYYSEEEKGFTANHAYTLIEAANLSPAIGSKLRKLHTAMQTNKFEKDVIEKRGWDVTIDGKYNLSPKYSIVGDLAAASLNIPLDRAIAEAQSVAEVLDDRNTKWQRIALVMGWRTWNVGATNEEHDLIKADARVIRKEEGKEKAKNTRDKNKEIEKQKVANLTPEQRQKEARDKALAKREKAIAKRKAKYAEMQNK